MVPIVAGSLSRESEKARSKEGTDLLSMRDFWLSSELFGSVVQYVPSIAGLHGCAYTRELNGAVTIINRVIFETTRAICGNGCLRFDFVIGVVRPKVSLTHSTL